MTRKDELRRMYANVIDKLGYDWSADYELVEFLLDQEVTLEEKHGSPFCPCQGLTGDRDEDMLIVCPCIPFHREHFDKMKRCWCGLFVMKGVTGPLPQIPEPIK
jgi:ferredoxin-thioredoxin reductase catalytic chain